ncbi:MAG: hypothetical protein FWG96_03605 [Methanomassiliicoccaceae archaeon]|nr:hypothetical protein [Methanomassiliicoccaceae archaeon]
MQNKGRIGICPLLALVVALVMIPAAAVSVTGINDISFEDSFGGNRADVFCDVTAVSDGVVAVGWAEQESFRTGDWAGISGKGGTDATIVKYNDAGDVIWKKNFGGRGDDMFHSVTAVSDGIIAVGASGSASFGNGDWSGIEGNGGTDAIIVKYNDAGEVMWRKNVGGAGADVYHSVTAAPGGFVTVGLSDIPFSFFEKGPDLEWSGYGVAVIVRYNDKGDIVWVKSFAEPGGHSFVSVAAVSDGFVVLGTSSPDEKGNRDYVVKYDSAGNMKWWRYFCAGDFRSIAAVSDGFVVVGSISANYFGSGIWTGVKAKSSVADAVILKFNNAGDLVWNKNFGEGTRPVKCYYFHSATAVPDGIIAAGDAHAASGANITYSNAIAVKYSNAGEVLWEDDSSGDLHSKFYSVTAVPDGFVAAGASGPTPIEGKIKQYDALVVKYGTVGIIHVTNITNVPNRAAVGTYLSLTGTVAPANAAGMEIVWTVKDPGTTGATINGNVLHTTSTGTVIVTATVANDTYEKDFAIVIGTSEHVVVKDDGFGSNMLLYAGAGIMITVLCAGAATMLIGRGAKRNFSGS